MPFAHRKTIACIMKLELVSLDFLFPVAEDDHRALLLSSSSRFQFGIFPSFEILFFLELILFVKVPKSGKKGSGEHSEEPSFSSRTHTLTERNPLSSLLSISDLLFLRLSSPLHGRLLFLLLLLLLLLLKRGRGLQTSPSLGERREGEIDLLRSNERRGRRRRCLRSPLPSFLFSVGSGIEY